MRGDSHYRRAVPRLRNSAGFARRYEAKSIHLDRTILQIPRRACHAVLLYLAPRRKMKFFYFLAFVCDAGHAQFPQPRVEPWKAIKTQSCDMQVVLYHGGMKFSFRADQKKTNEANNLISYLKRFSSTPSIYFFHSMIPSKNSNVRKYR